MVSLTQKLAAAAILAIGLNAPVWAQTQAQTPSSQLQKLNECNLKANAQGYTGETRKAYVSACIGGRSVSPVNKALNAAQQKTGACDDQANAQKLGGEARQTFLKSCLR